MFCSMLIVPGSSLCEVKIKQTLTKTSELNEQVIQIPAAFTYFTLTSLLQLMSSNLEEFPVARFFIPDYNWF